MRVLTPPVVFSIVCLLVSPTLQAQDKSQSHQFQLAAGNDEWTNTGFRLTQGDLVVIFASGTVTVGALMGQVDADGRNSRQATGIGFIEGKVGSGNPFAVGQRFAFGADQVGTLKLRVHDTNYADNTGTFTVTVIRIPASQVPAVETYTPDDDGPSEGTAPPANNAVYVAAMKTDLRNLVTAEEAFFADSVKYTAKIGPGGLNYSVSSGNTWPTVRLTRDGWNAVIGNGNTPTRCAIFIGSASAPPAIKEGAPNCQ